jgi:hypothetical protein
MWCDESTKKSARLSAEGWHRPALTLANRPATKEKAGSGLSNGSTNDHERISTDQQLLSGDAIAKV